MDNEMIQRKVYVCDLLIKALHIYGVQQNPLNYKGKRSSKTSIMLLGNYFEN